MKTVDPWGLIKWLPVRRDLPLPMLFGEVTNRHPGCGAMPLYYQPYAILLLSAAGIAGALAVSVLRFRPTLGSYSFSVLMGSIAMWAFLSWFEVINQDMQVKEFSGNAKYLFIVAVPVAWFIFALYYSNRIKQLRISHFLLLAFVPVLTVIMVATNDMHHLMFKRIEWRSGDHYILPVRQFGAWFWLHTTYSYALLFLGFLFLARACIDTQRIYRRQALSLLAAALAPWLCNILFLTRPRGTPPLDFTPFAFMLSGLAIMWGMLRYRLLEIVPVARDIVVQNMRDGVLVVDTHCRILDLNAAAAELLDKPQQNLIGQNAGQVIPWWQRLTAGHPEDPSSWQAVLETERRGQPLQLKLSASALNHKGESLGRLILLHDVTEMRTHQELMRRSEDRFKAISENAPVVILAFDESGLITYVNHSWKTLLGHEREQVVGRAFREFVASDRGGSYSEMFERLISGRESVAEGHVNLKHINEGQRTFNFTASVNSDGEGRITGIICVAKDVTEEERLRAQLFQSQKMEAIGTLAGGIAHDFNNLLMGMQANISLLRLENENNESLQDKFRRIEDQIQCGASLTRQLLGYARKGKYVVAPLNIHSILHEALQVVQRTNKHIRVHRRFDADPSILEADQGQMELVFLNLLVNAADAMPKGGDLTVTTRCIGTADQWAQWPDLKAGNYIEIQVADTGIGMDHSTMERIFEPFFTTKEIGRGTGLGLASVYGVIKNHFGHIYVQSEVGGGSTFTLLFPAAPSGELKALSPQARAETSPRRGKILLIDDEREILDYIGEMVRRLGLTVLKAASGEEAIGLFEKNHRSIHGVILDMYLPGMNGDEIYAHLQAIDPEVKVIIASGHGLSDLAETVVAKGGQVLSKPFTIDELALAIAHIMGGSGRSPSVAVTPGTLQN